MTNLEAKIKEYREYARMIEEMEAIKSSIGDELKEMMKEEGKDKMIIGEYKLSYTDVTRKDVDKKALQTEQPEIYNKYLTATTYKRFTVS